MGRVTERSDQVHAQYVEAIQKYDYFVAGVSLALVGYLGRAFQPAHIGWNAATVELLSIVALLVSAISGLKRVETNVTLLATSHRRLYEQEAAGATASAAASGGMAINRSTGDVSSPAQLAQDAQSHYTFAQVADEACERLKTKTGRWYRVRNRSLWAGLVLLVLARTLPALFD